MFTCYMTTLTTWRWGYRSDRCLSLSVKIGCQSIVDKKFKWAIFIYFTIFTHMLILEVVQVYWRSEDSEVFPLSFLYVVKSDQLIL